VSTEGEAGGIYGCACDEDVRPERGLPVCEDTASEGVELPLKVVAGHYDVRSCASAAHLQVVKDQRAALGDLSEVLL